MIITANKRIFFISLVLISMWFSIIYFHSFFEGIINGMNNYIVACADFGQYSYEALTYSNSNYLDEVIESDKEPALFLVVILLEKILSIEPKIALLLTDLISHFLLLLGVGILIIKITGKNIYGLIAVLILGTVYQTNIAYSHLYSRQLFSITFLVFLIYIFEYKKPKLFLGGTFLATLILSHRSGMMIGIAGLIIATIFDILQKNKYKYKNIKIFILGIIFSGAYLYTTFYDYLGTFNWLIGKRSADVFISEEFFLKKTEKIGGWSFFTWTSNSQIKPLLEYFIYQGIILLTCLSFIKKMKIRNNMFISCFIFLIIYSSGLIKLPFATRMLITIEPLFIIILTIGLYRSNQKKIKILLISGLIVLGLIGLEKKSLNLDRLYEKDSSIIQLEETLNKENSVLLTDNRCFADLLTQLGYKTGINISNKKIKKNMNEIELLDYYQTQELAQKSLSSIQEKPFLHNIFSQYNIYIVYSTLSDTKTRNELNAGSHRIFEIPYLNIIYRNNFPGRIKYIFQIDKSQITFFDTKNYLNLNM